MHGLGKVYAVEHLNFVAPFLQKRADLPQHTALGVYNHIGRMGLQELRREPKAGLAGAGRADPAEIEVAGVGGIFRTGVMVSRSVAVSSILFSNLGSTKGLMSFSLPHEAFCQVLF